MNQPALDMTDLVLHTVSRHVNIILLSVEILSDVLEEMEEPLFNAMISYSANLTLRRTTQYDTYIYVIFTHNMLNMNILVHFISKKGPKGPLPKNGCNRKSQNGKSSMGSVSSFGADTVGWLL